MGVALQTTIAVLPESTVNEIAASLYAQCKVRDVSDIADELNLDTHTQLFRAFPYGELLQTGQERHQ